MNRGCCIKILSINELGLHRELPNFEEILPEGSLKLEQMKNLKNFLG
jgi:hypothetical protein